VDNVLPLEMLLLRLGSSCLLEGAKKTTKKGKDSAVDIFLPPSQQRKAAACQVMSRFIKKKTYQVI